MIGLIFWICVGFIVYVYAGYPLLLAGLARLRSERKDCDSGEPRVTLLIAAYNEAGVIARKLENSLQLDYPREKLQILVVADGSTDQTAEIVQAYAGRGVELVFGAARQGKMAAINRAMGRVSSEVVVFSDANNHYPPGVLRALLAPFCDPQVGAATGAKSIVQAGDGISESEGLYWKYESFIKQQETRLGSCTGVSGEILAVRRQLYTTPPDRVINDDFFIAMRVLRQGYRVVYVPHARSYEHASPTTRDEMVRRARIVAGRFQAMAYAPQLLPWRQPAVVWQVVSHKFFRPLVPFAMLGALAANLLALVQPEAPGWNPVVALTHPYNWIAISLQAAFYGLAWLGSRVEVRGVLGKVLFLPTFLVSSNLAALVGLYQYRSGSQTAGWQRVARREEIVDP